MVVPKEFNSQIKGILLSEIGILQAGQKFCSHDETLD